MNRFCSKFGRKYHRKSGIRQTINNNTGSWKNTHISSTKMLKSLLRKKISTIYLSTFSLFKKCHGKYLLNYWHILSFKTLNRQTICLVVQCCAVQKVSLAFVFADWFYLYRRPLDSSLHDHLNIFKNQSTYTKFQYQPNTHGRLDFNTRFLCI